VSRDEEELERARVQLRSLSVALPALIEHVRKLADAQGHTLETPLPDPQKAGQRLAAFAAYLESFGRGDARTLGPIDVRSVLEEAVALARGEIEPKGRVGVSYQPAPLVHASPRQLGQVFIALLINAAQALPTGAPDDNYVEIELDTTGAGWARIAIADSGAGIPEDVLPRIFEPHYSTKRGEGLGVGLAAVREIVQELGGRIKVESMRRDPRVDLEGGTLFVIELPPAS
jgi:C4-dicarboxylate-specific signal transduction histidine kinase